MKVPILLTISKYLIIFLKNIISLFAICSPRTRAMEILMNNAIVNPKLRVTFATHNEESIDFGTQLINGKNHPSIQFAQINGLGDHLSLKLTDKNIKVLKLVPCGTYDDVLPWLARRMQENNDAKKRVATEKHLILNELKTRVIPSIFTVR